MRGTEFGKALPFGLHPLNGFDLIDESRSFGSGVHDGVFDTIFHVEKEEKTEPKDGDWIFERNIEDKLTGLLHGIFRQKGTNRVCLRKRNGYGMMFHRGTVNSHEAFRYMANTMLAVTDSHTITAERQALRKLHKLLSEERWRQYTLTGIFCEKSERSQKKYWFRRCAPIVVSISRELEMKEGLVPCSIPIVALCIHPHGYYEGTTAGALCPTDNIIAELLLMRSDECTLWKKSTQHPIYEPNARL